MENELEMIQTLFEYQNFGLAPFPIMPFSKEIHKDDKGKIFFDNAQSGIQMSEEEIYDWFGEKNQTNFFSLQSWLTGNECVVSNSTMEKLSLIHI